MFLCRFILFRRRRNRINPKHLYLLRLLAFSHAWPWHARPCHFFLRIITICMISQQVVPRSTIYLLGRHGPGGVNHRFAAVRTLALGHETIKQARGPGPIKEEIPVDEPTYVSSLLTSSPLRELTCWSAKSKFHTRPLSRGPQIYSL
jgi:hypothetical protein